MANEGAFRTTSIWIIDFKHTEISQVTNKIGLTIGKEQNYYFCSGKTVNPLKTLLVTATLQQKYAIFIKKTPIENKTYFNKIMNCNFVIQLFNPDILAA